MTTCSHDALLLCGTPYHAAAAFLVADGQSRQVTVSPLSACCRPSTATHCCQPPTLAYRHAAPAACTQQPGCRARPPQGAAHHDPHHPQQPQQTVPACYSQGFPAGGVRSEWAGHSLAAATTSAPTYQGAVWKSPHVALRRRVRLSPTGSGVPSISAWLLRFRDEAAVAAAVSRCAASTAALLNPATG
jgi:hypothetical protein